MIVAGAVLVTVLPSKDPAFFEAVLSLTFCVVCLVRSDPERPPCFIFDPFSMCRSKCVSARRSALRKRHHSRAVDARLMSCDKQKRWARCHVDDTLAAGPLYGPQPCRPRGPAAQRSSIERCRQETAFTYLRKIIQFRDRYRARGGRATAISPASPR